MDDRTEVGSVRSPSIARDRTPDGRPVYIVDGRRYVEVPLGPGDAYRFLGELRLEMTGPDFRAFVERLRPSLGAAVLWRLGLGPMPLAPEEPNRVERARAGLGRLLRAA
jgi:hypothetical protein